MTEVRTRFAPSPTGFLHVGGARTALYAWLYARKHGGKFILRVEDTDRERSTDESIQAILDGMEWLGLDYDEGPFYQTQRMERYHEVIAQLLEQGDAYRCTCSKERLDKLREQQKADKQKPRYDGCCRDANIPADTEQPFVIRFRNPTEGAVVIHDLVYGDITVNNSELDDLIIARSDGTPTYNLTVVVDDWEMKITHVIRGDDHINNTPRQINILNALGAELPKYAHLPMILGDDGKRLSKRHGAVSVLSYREEGYLPHALLNYLVRLGWSYGDQEIFSIDEMIEHFDLSRVSRSAAAFNTEKLQWLNQQYLKTTPRDELATALLWLFDHNGITLNGGPELTDVINSQAQRCKTLKEMLDKSHFFYHPVAEYDEEASAKHFTVDVLPMLEAITEQLSGLDEWSKDSIKTLVKSFMKERSLKMPQVAQPLRIAVTGNTISPSIDETLYLLGRDETLSRLNAAIEHLRAT